MSETNFGVAASCRAGGRMQKRIGGTDMEIQNTKRARLCRTLLRTALVLTALALLYMTLVGLFVTCRIDINFSEDNSEHVSFLSDNPLLHIGVLAAVLVGVFLMTKARIDRRAVRIATVAGLVLTTALGIWWVLAARAVPGADAKSIWDAALLCAGGDYGNAIGGRYFRVFPFQTGYLLYAEAFVRLFGADSALTAAAIVNVLLVDVAYLSVYRIADDLFSDDRITLLTVLMGTLCLQPVLLSTFLYGTLPGMAVSLAAVSLAIRYFKRGGFVRLIVAAALMGIAVTLKMNLIIVMIASVIILLLWGLRNKRAVCFVAAALMIVCSVAMPRLVKAGYERKLGESLGAGTPFTAWLVTGFRESSFCCGWYNSYTTTVLEANDFDADAAKAQIMADFAEQANMFLGRPRYLAAFMYKKATSQWCEPAFQSIWSSATSEHTSPVSPFVDSLYFGAGADAVNAYFNCYVQVIYIGTLACLCLLLFQKREEPYAAMLLPIAVLGAFMYHALFEAKSQYAIIYLPMLLPYAAFALVKVCSRLRRQAK